MRLFRGFPWDARVGHGVRGGALWFPRIVQGSGRHDNPLLYGCLYVTARALSAVVEQFARLSGTFLSAGDLVFAGLPLALAAIDLDDGARVVDLDEPRILAEEDLRPSLVATRQREVTQPQALALHEARPAAAGLRWWSTFESLWANYTIFDRAARDLRLVDVRSLTVEDAAVVEAAGLLGLAI